MSIGRPANWRVVLLRLFVNFMTFLGVLGGMGLMTQPAQASNPVAPRVGNCYSLNLVELSSPTSTKKPVTCTSSHSAETYRVAQWRGTANPAALSEVRRRASAEKICQPWKQESKVFTNWSYKVPTVTEWRNGLRTIRCDAYALDDEDPTQPKRFNSKQLDFS